VGKSTLARLIAREYAAAGWDVEIADLDISQATSLSLFRSFVYRLNPAQGGLVRCELLLRNRMTIYRRLPRRVRSNSGDSSHQFNLP
jgi:cellulose biosynthesis protein BcsQ